MGAQNSGKSSKGKKKVPGKPFQPGRSGNPGGRPKLSAEDRALRNMTKEQFREVANLLIEKDDQELMRIASTPGTPFLMVWLIQCYLKGAENGDYDTLDKLMNRVIGKVRDEVDMNFPKPLVIEKLDGSQIIVGTTRDIEGEQDE